MFYLPFFDLKIKSILIKNIFVSVTFLVESGFFSYQNCQFWYEKKKKKSIFWTSGVEGFEPPNGGIKTRCLTTWRHPISIFQSTMNLQQSQVSAPQLSSHFLLFHQIYTMLFSSQRCSRHEQSRTCQFCSPGSKFDGNWKPNSPEVEGGVLFFFFNPSVWGKKKGEPFLWKKKREPRGCFPRFFWRKEKRQPAGPPARLTESLVPLHFSKQMAFVLFCGLTWCSRVKTPPCLNKSPVFSHSMTLMKKVFFRSIWNLPNDRTFRQAAKWRLVGI